MLRYTHVACVVMTEGPRSGSTYDDDGGGGGGGVGVGGGGGGGGYVGCGGGGGFGGGDIRKCNDSSCVQMCCTTAWCVVKLRMEETACRYGGQLSVYLTSGSPAVDGPSSRRVGERAES